MLAWRRKLGRNWCFPEIAFPCAFLLEWSKYLLDELPQVSCIFLQQMGDVTLEGPIAREGNAQALVAGKDALPLVCPPLLCVVEVCCLPSAAKVQIAWGLLQPCIDESQLKGSLQRRLSLIGPCGIRACSIVTSIMNC